MLQLQQLLAALFKSRLRMYVETESWALERDEWVVLLLLLDVNTTISDLLCDISVSVCVHAVHTSHRLHQVVHLLRYQSPQVYFKVQLRVGVSQCRGPLCLHGGIPLWYHRIPRISNLMLPLAGSVLVVRII